MNWELHPIEDFDAQARSWQDLNLRTAKSPLLDSLFIGPAIRAFAKGDETLAVCRGPGGPCAMGILQRTGRFSWQTFQPANAPLGAWLCARDIELTGCLAALLRALPGAGVVLGLTQLDPDFDPRPAPTARLRTRDYITTPWVAVEGSYEDYWNGRSKNFRRDLKRQANRLEREGVSDRLETLRAPSDMPRAVADYARLEQSGWKADRDTAVGTDDPQGRFYVAMLQAFAESGHAAVYRYFFDDDLVASDICIERDGVMIVLKTAHDHSRKGTSPAQLMRHEIFRHAFDSGEFRRIEFYGPVMDWHGRWTDLVRRVYHLNFYRWPGAGALHDRLSVGKQADAAVRAD